MLRSSPRDNFPPESQRIFGGLQTNMGCMVFVWSFSKHYKNPLRSNTRRIFCFVPANCQPNATNLQHKSFMQLISLQAKKWEYTKCTPTFYRL